MSIRLKQVGNLMIWSCVGMAYFNAVSTLNLDPAPSFITAAVPIALIGGWVLRSHSSNDHRPDKP